MKRREFIERSVALGLAAAAGGAGAVHADAPLPCRPFGSSGRELSVVGFGGIVVMNVEQPEADAIVARSVERGVNYFDVAPTYGNAQDRLGPALRPFRDDVFLACKTAERRAEDARRELENSLRVLETDHLDLYQLHALNTDEDIASAFGPGGAMEAFVAARERGEVLHLGFSAHSVEAALRAMGEYPFDSILFPFNVVCMRNGNFGQQVLDEATARGLACLALKALAWTPWGEGEERAYPKCWYRPVDDPQMVGLALRYTLDLQVVSAVSPGDVRLLEAAIDAAVGYQPLSDQERAMLAAMTEGVEPIFSYAQD